MNNPASKAYHFGRATYFYQYDAYGACGHIHGDNDLVLALQWETYGNGEYCGKKVCLTHEETNVTACGIVADKCPGCDGPGNIDLSTGLFDIFAPEINSSFPVTWKFVD
ncbi:hypothetical protein M422DRAFT_238935 [Sphaerobolus stellatus SS14]|nr:hypothetical protein M422DRAFT_238935 [Sphaerobolus stellatus SS14]